MVLSARGETMTPTARTLAWLRDQGHLAGVVERYNEHTRRHHDLFEFIDIVSISPDGKTFGWQATSSDNVAARIKKIQANKNLAAVLAAGRKVGVVGWKKYAKPVNRRWWRPRVVEV